MTSPCDSDAAPGVLIASAGVGAGHNAAASAVAETLRRSQPSVDPTVIDALDDMPGWFNAFYAGGFKLSMTRLPWLYGLGYRISNRYHGPRRRAGERLRLASERWAAGRLADHLVRENPRVLVHTHFLTPPLAHHLAGKGRLGSTSVVVVTDVDVHRFWYSQGVEHWYVPAERSADDLMAHGIEAGRISVTGIPVHPKWQQELERERMLEEWSLPDDQPIVLLSGGAEFTCGPVLEMARQVLDRCEGIHLVLLAGKNQELIDRGAKMTDEGLAMSVIGFTVRNHELVSVSDLMITKAGGITTFECISSATPTVLYRPVPGQEKGNAEFLQDQGVGVIVEDPDKVADATAKLLAEPSRLERMREACRTLHRPAAELISRDIIERIS